TRPAGLQPSHEPVPIRTLHTRVPRRAAAVDVHHANLRSAFLDPGPAVLDLALGRALPIITKSRHTRVDVKNECHRGSSRHGVTNYSLTPEELAIQLPRRRKNGRCGVMVIGTVSPGSRPATS